MAKKYLDYDGLLFFWTKLKSLFATKEQGNKADTAVQSVKIGESGAELKLGSDVVLPEYPIVPDNNVTAVKVGNETVSGVSGVADITTPINNAISTAVSDIAGMEFVKLQTGEFDADTGVPTIAGEAGKIYLTTNSGSTPNQYDEYIWLASDNAFEKIGTTAVDLSGYVLASELVAVTNAEIETIVNT